MSSAIRPLITYSRTKRNQGEDDIGTLKRRRIDITHTNQTHLLKPQSSSFSGSSSPFPSSSTNLDDPLDLRDTSNTPPSSPPPPCDAILKPLSSTRPFQARSSLAEPSTNTCSAPKPSPKPPTPKPLIQSQLNLGARSQKSCKECGMTYTLSSAEDVSIHKQHHSTRVLGLDLGRSFRQRTSLSCKRDMPSLAQNQDVLCAIDKSFPSSFLKKAHAALEIAQVELGAVEISVSELWMDYGCRARDGSSPCTPRYKLYLYMRGTRCIGICLVERIESAVWHALPDGESATVVLDDEPDAITSDALPCDAQFGISRIWVLKQYRQQGIARRMLDAVCQTALPNESIAKQYLAFSQPTEGGFALARRWLGAETARMAIYQLAND